MVTYRVSSLIGGNSHTEPSVRRQLRQSLKGNLRFYGWSLKGNLRFYGWSLKGSLRFYGWSLKGLYIVQSNFDKRDSLKGEKEKVYKREGFCAY
jgi:hypothetical protein